jgi:glutamyl-Q tRNA(Asp) synthetase
MHDSLKAYRGRFAPSPTGPLHFGSLVAAVGSYLEARVRGGSWLVRMEDLDKPREAPGAADAILRMLEAHGFEWNGEVVFQSRRHHAYREALAHLEQVGAAFPCACTRKEIADSALGLEGDPIYPGTCRGGLPAGRSGRALRVRADGEIVGFDDAIQGRIEQNPAREIGDFIVRRADGLYAYQLAVVVDDAAQGINNVVRGADLLASTPRQILLQRLLGNPAPGYMHLPVALSRRGEKLSKQTRAGPLAAADAGPQLSRALRFLGQQPPADLGGVREVWDWALTRWNPDRIPRQRGISVDEPG